MTMPSSWVLSCFLLVCAVCAAPLADSAETPRSGHPGRVLIVASDSVELILKDGRHVPTGYYLDELAVPAMQLLDAGYDLVLATPSGGKPQMDPRSKDKATFGNDETALAKALDFVENHFVMQLPQTLKAVARNGLDGFAGIYVPGGHAPMNDLMQDADLGDILRHFHDAGKPTAFLCHGPIASLATLPDPAAYRAALVVGDTTAAQSAAAGWPYAGYRMTIFSDAEEQVVVDSYLKSGVPFSVASALRTAGATVENGDPFKPFIITDRELITGQNPSSDHGIATALVKALEEASRKPKPQPKAVEQPEK